MYETLFCHYCLLLLISKHALRIGYRMIFVSITSITNNSRRLKKPARSLMEEVEEWILAAPHEQKHQYSTAPILQQ